jgi:hypothetical protein
MKIGSFNYFDTTIKKSLGKKDTHVYYKYTFSECHSIISLCTFVQLMLSDNFIVKNISNGSITI